MDCELEADLDMCAKAEDDAVSNSTERYSDTEECTMAEMVLLDHLGDRGAPTPTPEMMVPEPWPWPDKKVYNIKIFQKGNDASPLFRSDFHWGHDNDAFAALQALVHWYDRHTDLIVVGRVYCDTLIYNRVLRDMIFNNQPHVVVEVSSSSSESANPTGQVPAAPR